MHFCNAPFIADDSIHRLVVFSTLIKLTQSSWHLEVWDPSKTQVSQGRLSRHRLEVRQLNLLVFGSLDTVTTFSLHCGVSINHGKSRGLCKMGVYAGKSEREFSKSWRAWPDRQLPSLLQVHSTNKEQEIEVKSLQDPHVWICYPCLFSQRRWSQLISKVKNTAFGQSEVVVALEGKCAFWTSINLFCLEQLNEVESNKVQLSTKFFFTYVLVKGIFVLQDRNVVSQQKQHMALLLPWEVRERRKEKHKLFSLISYMTFEFVCTRRNERCKATSFSFGGLSMTTESISNFMQIDSCFSNPLSRAHFVQFSWALLLKDKNIILELLYGQF